jgi:hypothetical protein
MDAAASGRQRPNDRSQIYQVSTPVSSVATLLHLQFVPPGWQKQMSSPVDDLAQGMLAMLAPGRVMIEAARKEADISFFTVFPYILNVQCEY